MAKAQQQKQKHLQLTLLSDRNQHNVIIIQLKIVKSKNNYVGLHQTKKLLLIKRNNQTINKMKKQSTEWEKIFASYKAKKG